MREKGKISLDRKKKEKKRESNTRLL